MLRSSTYNHDTGYHRRYVAQDWPGIQMAKQESIECPPFPPLTWDEFHWSAPCTLPAWVGFQSRGGAYCTTDSENPSDGTIHLMVCSDEVSRDAPSTAQVAAFEFLLENDSQLSSIIVNRIYAEYPSIKEQYSDFLDPEDLAECVPEIRDAHDLRRIIGLGIIHVHRIAKNGVAYVGFELGCSWEIEHGLGVLMHCDRIVEYGGADTSFLEWIAERDAAE